MDWPTIINEILWMEEITEKHLSTQLSFSTNQSTINRLKLGRTRSPHYELGLELIKRHKKLKRQYQSRIEGCKNG